MESIEHYYKKIAESINELIPYDWDKVWMYAEILDDSAGITFCFNETNSEEYVYGHEIPLKYNVSKSTYIHLLYELSKTFEELKKAYIQNDLGAWTTATLQLDKTGKFSIDYGYEDILSIGLYGIQRRAVWEYKTFGFLPEDEKDKEAVLNYLKNKEENRK
ncbi:immunity protein YezG family protein [Bacillus altitudinis]|uniref:immunity protein YezG family protein n=1 Tax=Bacillus altitudinis TaxID=293387 RepID=UPI0011A28031|nr:TIGR01741 family protein [Bacillus altitudinis]